MKIYKAGRKLKGGDPNEIFYNPMRVVANGSGSEVTFTLFRQVDVDDAKFQEDAAMIQSDLIALKELLESEGV